MKARFRSIGRAFLEAFICLGLALRSSLRPGILIGSAGLCLLMTSLWGWLFYAHFEFIAKAAGLIATFVVMGAAALGLLPSISGGPATISAMASIAPALALMAVYAALLAVAIVVVLYAGAVVLSIRLSLRWVLMRRLKTRARSRYPSLLQRQPAAADLLRAGRYHLGPLLGIGLGPLLCLLIPVVNGVLLLMLLAYLNVRFLVPTALAGLASGAEQMRVVRVQRGALIAFGVLILMLALVPVLNLLLPALLGGGVCHLAYRGLDRLDTPAGMAPEPQVSLPAP
ncbi:EI24 domain-containing protein [Metapseudomonas otitidis]|uniref:EI24 domain-containing protein n=1 Tax=Metapseudomonas otitidis TaxID=319939 RepID=UPI00227CDF46|nr:EI24 domain-containing protein [Pseudomonas otitidis]WAF86576.1 EI24 domain-containing protein [Pseudomonas otitidis]